MGRHATAAAQPSPCPLAPSYLLGPARELWPGVVQKLIAKGSWDPDCETLICLYCTSLVNVRMAIEHISRDGPIVEASITNVACHSVWRRVLSESSLDALRYGNILDMEPTEEVIWARQEARAEPRPRAPVRSTR